ncbi:MAG: enoyl-CoA hydratase/isomerase family protein [Thermoanaerobaculum sp.]|nr:enoyl-CoA hydratase/isomerase family protein [Thermoanaerobaculum sp.]
MEPVRLERRHALAFLELVQPQTRNALSREVVDLLTEHLSRLRGENLRALILAGSGGHFCAGAHLGELAESLSHAAEALREANRLAALFAALVHFPHLTVAAVEGSAFGGGAGLACACDFVVASPTAVFQFSELRLGFVPALISVLLLRRLPSARLAQLFLNPRPLPAEEAKALGLVDEVVASPRQRAEELALEVAQKTAPSAVTATKRMLLELAHPQLEQHLARAAHLNATQRQQEDFRQGVEFFLAQKRFRDWLTP